MGFFDQSNTRLETVWFSVLAVISTLCFPFGVRLGRRFPQILSAKLVVRVFGSVEEVKYLGVSAHCPWNQVTMTAHEKLLAAPGMFGVKRRLAFAVLAFLVIHASQG